MKSIGPVFKSITSQNPSKWSFCFQENLILYAIQLLHAIFILENKIQHLTIHSPLERYEKIHACEDTWTSDMFYDQLIIMYTQFYSKRNHGVRSAQQNYSIDSCKPDASYIILDYKFCSQTNTWQQIEVPELKYLWLAHLLAGFNKRMQHIQYFQLDMSIWKVIYSYHSQGKPILESGKN